MQLNLLDLQIFDNTHYPDTLDPTKQYLPEDQVAKLLIFSQTK